MNIKNSLSLNEFEMNKYLFNINSFQNFGKNSLRLFISLMNNERIINSSPIK